MRRRRTGWDSSLPDRQSVPGGSNCGEPSAKRITWFLEGDGHTHAMQVWTHTCSYCACGTASGSECGSPSTHRALGTHVCQAGVIDEGEIIRQLMPNPRFSKRPCLKGIRWRMITQHLMPSTLVHRCEHQHTPVCIYTQTQHSHTQKIR